MLESTGTVDQIAGGRRTFSRHCVKRRMISVVPGRQQMAARNYREIMRRRFTERSKVTNSDFDQSRRPSAGQSARLGKSLRDRRLKFIVSSNATTAVSI